MRLLPRRRLPRVVLIVVLVLAALATLFLWVFPWIDRTFVNRPQIGVAVLLAASEPLAPPSPIFLFRAS